MPAQHLTDSQTSWREPGNQEISERYPNLTFKKKHHQMSDSTNISETDRVINDDHKETQQIPTVVKG
jgi:hypothetical protein